MDLTGKPFEASDQKNNRKKTLDPAEKEELNAKILKATYQPFPRKQYEYGPRKL